MTHVLVYGERVEIPDGWIVVGAGDLAIGDLVIPLDGPASFRPASSHDVRRHGPGEFVIAIRPDRPATGATK